MSKNSLLRKSKASKSRRPPLKEPPPASDPHFWYVYRVNRLKTIFWQLPMTFLSGQAAEIEASRLDCLGVVNGKSYFYAALDGPSALHLWHWNDVRPGKWPAGSSPARKFKLASSQQIDEDELEAQSGWMEGGR